MSSSPFFSNLLDAIRFPDLESAHQTLLVAALRSDASGIAALLEKGSLAPTSTTWPGINVDWVGASVRQEVSEGDARFDIVVQDITRTATILVECKWNAGTHRAQLDRYINIVTSPANALKYPNPLLMLVSADGAPPDDVAGLAASGVPVVTLAWSALRDLIVGAAGPLAAEIDTRLEQLYTHFDTFAADLCNGKRVPTRGGRAPVAIVAAGPLERYALFTLARNVLEQLGEPWRMHAPPHLGPRGDVQCDLVPDAALSLPFPVGDRPSAGWNVPLGALHHRLGRHTTASVQFVVRLYFSQTGMFEVHIGANLVPYVHALKPLVGCSEINAALPTHVGRYDDARDWVPGPTLMAVHDAARSARWDAPREWVAEGGSEPHMWQRYFTLRSVEGDLGGATRFERIADAITRFVSPSAWESARATSGVVLQAFEAPEARLTKHELAARIAAVDEEDVFRAVDGLCDRGILERVAKNSRTYRHA